jgi:hypothetical protein
MPLIIPQPKVSMPKGFRLGRFKSKPDRRTLKMARYRTGIAVKVPDFVDWTNSTGKTPEWGMMLNDSLGDCTCAAAGHIVEELTTDANAGVGVTIPDSSVLTMYEQACGYNPADPSTDQGGDMSTVLKYFNQTGLLDTNNVPHKIYAYISVNPMNLQEVKEAIYLFGNLYCGVNLPNTVQNEETVLSCWDVAKDYKTNPDAQPGSLGGHCIPLMGYSSKAFKLVSWGGEYYMTPNFLQIYCDELYAVLSMDWIEKNTNLSPSLFDLSQLQADLQIVTA